MHPQGPLYEDAFFVSRVNRIIKNVLLFIAKANLQYALTIKLSRHRAHPTCTHLYILNHFSLLLIYELNYT